MIVSGNLPSPGIVSVRPPGMVLVAGVDVEWSKNYRIRGGNVPFCYSSAYVHDIGETQDLATRAGLALGSVLRDADLIAGHQLSSDLAVLASASPLPITGVAAARAAWHQRRQATTGGRRIVDTRYDAGHVLACPSRRLVDVCADLRLDVTQPELRGTSMTALHRRWLETQDMTAREKITVLNLRHSLSTAIVAAHAAGLGRWQGGLNVNRLLAAGLGGAFGWLASPEFTALLGESDAA